MNLIPGTLPMFVPIPRSLNMAAFILLKEPYFYALRFNLYSGYDILVPRRQRSQCPDLYSGRLLLALLNFPNSGLYSGRKPFSPSPPF